MPTESTKLPVLSLDSPAKLNLILHITSRRSDGYHNLQTIFQLLDFGDTINFFSEASDNIILETTFDQIAPEENLIVRAAHLLKSATGTKKGIRISVNKRVPMGGGLGGGSSNAATVLVGLNYYWETNLSLSQLAELGVQLGADVPVFVMGNSAWAEGIGEKLTPIKLQNDWYLVIFPGIHVHTADIFSHIDLTRNTPIMTIRSALDGKGHNDCEFIVRKVYPEVDNALHWLDQFSPARLTGTGSCIFARFSNKAEAQTILAKLPGNYHGFVAQAVNRSTLHQGLGI